MEVVKELTAPIYKTNYMSNNFSIIIPFYYKPIREFETQLQKDFREFSNRSPMVVTDQEKLETIL